MATRLGWWYHVWNRSMWCHMMVLLFISFQWFLNRLNPWCTDHGIVRDKQSKIEPCNDRETSNASHSILGGSVNVSGSLQWKGRFAVALLRHSIKWFVCILVGTKVVWVNCTSTVLGRRSMLLSVVGCWAKSTTKILVPSASTYLWHKRDKLEIRSIYD